MQITKIEKLFLLRKNRWANRARKGLHFFSVCLFAGDVHLKVDFNAHSRLKKVMPEV